MRPNSLPRRNETDCLDNVTIKTYGGRYKSDVFSHAIFVFHSLCTYRLSIRDVNLH